MKTYLLRLNFSYKDGKGDPRGFINMLVVNNIPNKAFIRYVGNRLHVLFYLSGSVCLYRETLMAFFKNQCSAQALGYVPCLPNLRNT